MKNQKINRPLWLLEAHLETGSITADSFRNADRRLVQIGNIPHDGQAKAGACGSRSRDTEKTVENPPVILRINSNSVIGDIEDGFILIRP